MLKDNDSLTVPLLKGGEHLRRVLVVALFVIISFFHLNKIQDIPRGYYCDELSIGYNAIMLAETGRDEHDRYYPVFFKAFGEYKNPVYIYTLSGIYKVTGKSEYALRFTSFLFFITFLAGFYSLVRDVFKENKIVPIYALLAAGFLPFFFTVSRISFEVISQLTMVVYSLLFIRRTYHSERYRSYLPILAGSFLGLSVYSYSTARLLTFLSLLSLIVLYVGRSYIKRTIVITITFLLAIIPYVVFVAGNPGALVERFRRISFLYDPSLSVPEKISLFIGNYISYFGFDFLLFRGDRNLRHATGYGGETFIVVYLLFLVGLGGLLLYKKPIKERFTLFMFINLLISPVAGSLTGGVASGEVPHLLRGILLGLYISFFSCWGMSYLSSVKNRGIQYALTSAVFVCIVFEASFYLHDYFGEYANKTIDAFKTYRFKDALAFAIEQNPKKVIVSSRANQSYILAKYYSRFVQNPRQLPIHVADPIPEKDACLIYFKWNEPIPETIPRKPIGMMLDGGVVGVRCY